METPMQQSLPPDVLFHSAARLLVYRPRGILNEHRINVIIAFLEKEEDAAHTPFNRFTDLSKLDALDLDVNAMIRISLYRRIAYGKYPAVKSAFFVTSPDTVRLLKVHVLLTEHSPIKVRMFGEMQNAAKWLEVAPELLERESSV
jgi:hypothetical protein